MDTPSKTSFSIDKTLFGQAEILAEHLNISPNQLIEMALENFIRHYQDQPDLNKPSSLSYSDTKIAPEIGNKRSAINQGDVYWVRLDDSEPDIPHPHVVIQDNVINHSRIHTVVVCALTSNTKRASIPGNLLLEAGEANLPRQSVVEASKVSTVEKTQLGEYIGSLTEPRIHQILAGMRFLQRSFFTR